MSYKTSQKIREDSFSGQLESCHKKTLEALDGSLELLHDTMSLVIDKHLIENNYSGPFFTLAGFAEELSEESPSAFEDDKSICLNVSTQLWFLAYRQLLGARRLLGLGYLENMAACMRGVIDSLYVSDICRQSAPQSKRFLKGKVVDRPFGLSVNKLIELLRRGPAWKLYCREGSHSDSSQCSYLSIAGRFISFAKDFQEEINSEEARMVIPFVTQIFNSVITERIHLMAAIVIGFTTYLQYVHKSIFRDNKEFRERSRLSFKELDKVMEFTKEEKERMGKIH